MNEFLGAITEGYPSLRTFRAKYLVPIISTRLFDELAEQHTINCGLSFSSPLHIELHCAIFKAQSARNVPGEAATELT